MICTTSALVAALVYLLANISVEDPNNRQTTSLAICRCDCAQTETARLACELKVAEDREAAHRDKIVRLTKIRTLLNSCEER